ncbi:hypothetical protein [Cohnella panacarvi]|uniref:hypothetical protein n=1 Tax=Cohnella panacarvi TaxID=400776 RepID=UPI00047D27DE|nr:hypothetical protein [Cohnella panacarvi]
MKEFLLDISVNIYEVIAVFAILLALFRFSLKDYFGSTIIAGVLMSQTSYINRLVFHMDSITPIFMLFWTFIFIWHVFRIHPFFATVMTVTGYLSYVLVQSVLILLLQIPFTFEQITTPLLHAKLVQFASSSITLFIAYWLLKRRIGFSFVPDRMNEKIEIKGLNLWLLLACAVSCFFISGIAYIFININFLFTTLTVAFMFSVIVLLNIAYRKEMDS